MDSRIKKILDKVLDTERFVYTSDKTQTYRGIVYGLHWKLLKEKYNINSWEELKNISLETLYDFYYTQYVVPSKAEEFIDVSINLAYQIVDFAINAGVSSAIKGIQKMYNMITDEYEENYGWISEDGDYGNQTKTGIRYIRNEYNLLMDMIEDHEGELKHLKVINNKVKTLDKVYVKIRQAHYFKLLDKMRDSGKHSDAHLMNCLESWNRRCLFRFKD